MHFATLATLLWSVTVTAAVVPTGREFYLRTVVTNGSAAFNNLYVAGYHTGAGLNDAVLAPKDNSYRLAKGFMNGTHQEFDLGSDFPYGFVALEEANYAGWEYVQINAGYGGEGFYYNNTDGSGVKGLKWVAGYPYVYEPTPLNEWIGWMVCDWFHGMPQLFWRVRDGVAGLNATLLCSCANVELQREFL